MANNSAAASFDLSLMPEADKRNLCSTFLEAVIKFYENPENKKKYDDWKKRRYNNGSNNE